MLLIDFDLLVMHAALSSHLPGAWSRVFTKHFGATERAWVWAFMRVCVMTDWDSYWWDKKVPVTSLAEWHDMRAKIVRNIFNVVKHDNPDLVDTQVSQAALKELEYEIGCECQQPLQRSRLAILKRLSIPIQCVSFKTSTQLAAGLLKSGNLKWPVIGPEELEQFDIDGMTWEKLCNCAKADPATSKLLSQRQIDDWPLVQPPDNWRSLPTLLKKLFQD